MHYFNNSHSLHFFLAAWPEVGSWFTDLGIGTSVTFISIFIFYGLPDQTRSYQGTMT